jgi:hypothetical protein
VVDSAPPLVRAALLKLLVRMRRFEPITEDEWASFEKLRKIAEDHAYALYEFQYDMPDPDAAFVFTRHQHGGLTMRRIDLAVAKAEFGVLGRI